MCLHIRIYTLRLTFHNEFNAKLYISAQSASQVLMLLAKLRLLTYPTGWGGNNAQHTKHAIIQCGSNVTVYHYVRNTVTELY